MSARFVMHTVAEINDAAEWLLSSCTGKKVFAFLGEMGSGKTTFVGAICSRLGVSDGVTSPTFSIVNEYHGVELIYHIDLYRIRDLDEALEAGVDEYIGSGNYCFIEWPQLLQHILPLETAWLKMESDESGVRTLTLTNYG